MGGVFRMVWSGPIVPYIRTTQRQKWVDPRYKKYAAWKDEFRLIANIQNFPATLDKDVDYSLAVTIRLAGARRYDCDNAGKGIADALFEQDTRISDFHVTAQEYTGEDRVEVELVERGFRATRRPARAGEPKAVSRRRRPLPEVGGGLRGVEDGLQGDRHPRRDS